MEATTPAVGASGDAPADDYAALTTGVGLVDPGPRTQIELTGRDSAKFLHSFSTNDIQRLAPGDGCEAFVLDVKGKIVAYLLVFREAESLILETVAGQAETIISHLDRYILREDVALHDRSESWHELIVAGDEAERVLAAGSSMPISLAACSHCATTWRGESISVRRLPWVANGFLLSGLVDAMGRVARRLVAEGMRSCGVNAWEIVRVEAGMPVYGRDVTRDNLPQEIGRDAQALSFTKGCYLGQETVARIDALGHVNRRLALISFAGKTVPVDGTQLLSEGKVVGRVTSAVMSPRFGSPVALAFLRASLATPGQQLESDGALATVLQPP